MKSELEPSDRQAIAEDVLEMLKPYLRRNLSNNAGDTIMDVKQLCDYLKVTDKWVYDQTHLKAIPHYKLTGKALRFKRSEIDKWMEKLKTPALVEPSGKIKLLR